MVNQIFQDRLMPVFFCSNDELIAVGIVSRLGALVTRLGLSVRKNGVDNLTR